MDKHHILEEIKRIAKSNNGLPPGREKFQRETGIKMSAWYPDYWLRWSDALVEAGFVPNKMQEAYTANEVLEKYAGFMRELGRFPVEGELRRKAKQDTSFPSHNVFGRFGGKKRLAARILNFCQSQGGWDDVLSVCNGLADSKDEPTIAEKLDESSSGAVLGSIYLIKSGRYYKIGRTISVGRREYELGRTASGKSNYDSYHKNR